MGISYSVTGLFPRAKSEKKEFVDLLWIVKGIRLFDCDEKGENYFKELGVLTGSDFSSNDLDWRGKGYIRYVPTSSVGTTHNSEVNIDSPHVLNGPDIFHVGYQTEGKKNIVGHILMDCLPYFRDVRKEND